MTGASSADGDGVIIIKKHPEIAKLKGCYLQSVPADKIPFEDLVPQRASWEFQDCLYNTVLDESAVEYPPAASYTRRFLKYLIEVLESRLSEDDEIHESILSLYSLQLSIPSSSVDVTKPTYVTYPIPLELVPSKNSEDHVIISERKSLLSADGHTGSRTWEAALALGEYFLKTTNFRKPISECRIIELGAGTGFVSILLSKLHAKFILATDGDENVCNFIRANFALNKVPCKGHNQEIEGNADVLRLLWGPDELTNAIYEEPWDLIVGGDITYDIRDLGSLVYTIKTLLENNKSRYPIALVSATVRNQETVQEFERLIGLELEYTAQSLGPDDRTLWYYGSDTPITIYTITIRT